MISSLEDAWAWYTSVRKVTETMSRLGRKHWTELPWTGSLGRDDRLRHIESAEIVDWAKVILEDLDDLCVLLLFSVFEATVRERALQDVAAEIQMIRHPALQQAVRSLNDSLEHGSFYRITKAYKTLNPGLTEQVNQVRKYRNWAAHGRRGEPENAVEPKAAYERLKLFLDRLLTTS